MGFGLGGSSRTSVAVVDPAATITSSSTVSVAENSVLAHSLTANETVTWSILAGGDGAKFELSSSTLRWASNGTKNYESPDDANTDNVYSVTVRATDSGANTTDQTISVTVTNVNEAPTITSSSTFSMAENTTAVGTLTSTDPDAGATKAWSIIGGADQAKFTINSSTGALAFATAPDYENPTDANTDNVYVVQVQVSDGSLTANQTINVTVTDVADLSLDFTAGIPAGVTVTSSPAVGYVKNSSGVIAQFSANAGRRTDLGIMIEPAATNLKLRSGELGSATTANYSLANVTVGSAFTGVDGNSFGGAVTETTANNQHSWGFGQILSRRDHRPVHPFRLCQRRKS
jgi:VCBS repeat-containing protein